VRRLRLHGDTGEFDPSCLLDDFRNDRPGLPRRFPGIPIPDIETITYVLAGGGSRRQPGQSRQLGASDVSG
jgi:redox-sensitive bicupin YhaK (pirin superfamily)